MSDWKQCRARADRVDDICAMGLTEWAKKIVHAARTPLPVYVSTHYPDRCAIWPYIIDHAGNVAANFCIEYDNLQAEWESLCERIGVEPVPLLEHLNKTKET